MKTINKKITTPDGFILDVIVFEPETPAKTEVFMCHGLTGSKDTKRNTLLNLAEKLCENGMRVIRFDFRGHGESSGIDLDVNLDSFIIDLDTVMRSERSDLQFMMFGFSFGGFTVSEYIHKKNIHPEKVVLWSPALDPHGSSFNNPKEFCYPEIYNAKQDGSLEERGYLTWASKNFRISKTFINQVEKYDYIAAIKNLPKETLIIQGINDSNVDKTYNEKYSKEFNIKYIELNASHSLFEEIDKATELTINFFKTNS